MKLHAEHKRILGKIGPHAVAHLSDVQEALNIPQASIENLTFELVCEGFLIMSHNAEGQILIQCSNLVPFKSKNPVGKRPLMVVQ